MHTLHCRNIQRSWCHDLPDVLWWNLLRLCGRDIMHGVLGRTGAQYASQQLHSLPRRQVHSLREQHLQQLRGRQGRELSSDKLRRLRSRKVLGDRHNSVHELRCRNVRSSNGLSALLDVPHKHDSTSHSTVELH